HAAWKGVKLSPTRVTYTYADSHLEVVKDFTISPETYVVRMELKVTVHRPGAAPHRGRCHREAVVTDSSLRHLGAAAIARPS
ncbi:MAG TPA: hypothetical protein VK601_05855, partial [Kofleriaceae bacterium]|nr:hypothetical protein [Kofleriaceae bacterium]